MTMLMRSFSRRSFLASSLTSPALFLQGNPLNSIQRLKTPENGLQAQAATDVNGNLHVVYLYGDPAAADVGYVRLERGQNAFSAPIRVNDIPGSAIAIGTVRGAHIAVGKSGRVHVAWNSSSKAAPNGPKKRSAMFYSRLSEHGNRFDPQRNLMCLSSGLDGGGSVAADAFGNVYVVWHARGEQNGRALDGEQHRRVWLAQSANDGETFAPERPVSPPELGACGCCGMGAIADAKGRLYLLYRTAREIVHRDMYLLVSADRGKTFRTMDLSEWNIGACPMSTVALASSGERVLLAWEKQRQIYFAAVHPEDGSAGPAAPSPGEGPNRKHPSIAVNERGEMLLAWTEGTGWSKGGSLAWQMFDPLGHAISQQEHSPGVPAWGSVAAARSGDRFLLVC